MQPTYGTWMTGGQASAGFGVGIIIGILLVVWSLYWKGCALWRAAQRGEKVWFVVLLLVNTLGILDILYLYLFSKEVLTKEKKK